MTRILFIFLLSAWSHLALGQRFEPVVHPVDLVEKIVVRGFNGRLQIEPTTGENVTVEAEKKGQGNLDRWSFQVRKTQNILEIFVKGPSEQEDWDKLRAKQNIPPFDMKVTAPFRPLEVFWNEGTVMAQGWQANLSVQTTSGMIQIAKGVGNLSLQMINGKIDVQDHEGTVDIQSFKGQVTLNKTKGAVRLNNHSALISMKEHKGPIDLRNHSGSITLKGVESGTSFKNVSGVVQLLDFSGSVDGHLEKGELRAQIDSLQNFNVMSEDAKVSVDAPKESGALVSLRSEKGRMWGPPQLRKYKKGLWTEYRGKLKGKEQGNIKIISKYGDIVLK